MDDHNFDDLIKNKLGNYEDPVFDPSALAAMQERLAGLRPSPWYAQTASRLFVVSSLLLFTLINAYVVKTALEATPTLQPLAITTPYPTHLVDSLNHVIAQLKCDVEQSSLNDARTQATLPSYKVSDPLFVAVPGNSDSLNEVGYDIKVGALNKIPVEVYTRLTKMGLLKVENGQGYILLYQRKAAPIQSVEPDDRMKLVTLEIIKPSPPRFILINSMESKDESGATKNKSGMISLSTQKALEKHYFKGVGIEIAPHIDAVKGIFTNGRGDITPRIGITADWILSPVLSVETGFDYLTTVNHINQSGWNSVGYHDNSQFGSPQSVSSTTTLGSMPLAVKYRRWITSKNQAVFKIGFTPYASFRKEYQYTYQYNDNSPDHDLVQVSTFDRHNDLRYFGTTVSGALGLTSIRSRNKGKFETSLFYERSLGKICYERQSMQLVGLRAAYWFKLK